MVWLLIRNIIANTVDDNMRAKNVKVLRYANTVDDDMNAKNVEVLRYVNTTDKEVTAKNARDLRYVNIIKTEVIAKNVDTNVRDLIMILEVTRSKKLNESILKLI